MKKTLGIIAFSILTGVTAVTAVSTALAWFFDGARVNPDKFFGSSQGAYFAYGTGTEGDPYGINTPRHMYNLSWLNMMGYFEGKGTDGVVYFEIDPDPDKFENGILDGTNPNTGKPLAIPPIGTEEHPFYGNFNGNGRILSNFIISADSSDYGTQKPYNYTDIFDVNNPPQIVGLFGVVGEIDEEPVEVVDPDTQETILVPRYSYDSSTNEITNLGISNITIKTKAEESLVGIVAGYVNGKISDVAVNASSIEINNVTTSATDYSDYLSEYGIVGHCTKNYSEVVDKLNDYYDKKDAYQTTAQIYAVNTVNNDPFNAHEQGEELTTGASIDLKKMYTRLHANWQVLINGNNTYKTKYLTGTKEISIKDGVTTIDSVTGTTENTWNNFNKGESTCYNGKGDGYHSYYSYTQSDNSHQTASYNYIIEPYSPYDEIGSSGLTEEDYMCLGGAKERTIPRKSNNQYVTHTLITNTYTDYEGYYISYTSGTVTNYLTRGANNLNLTSPTSASLWHFDNGRFYTTIQNNESNFYYLNCSNTGSLSVTTSPDTTWSYNSTRHAYYATVDNNNFYLGFDGTKWTTTIYHEATETYYLIHKGNNYITHGNENTNPGNLNSSTKPTDQSAKWYLSGSNFATASNGTVYLKLHYTYSFWSGASYSAYVTSTNDSSNVSVAPTTDFDFSNTNTNTRALSAYVNRNTRYLYYNSSSSSWTANSSSQDLTIDKVFVTQGYANDIHCGDVEYTDANQKFYKKDTTTNNSARSTLDTIPTYFPLKGTLTNQNLSVDDTNTGYVVSGSYFTRDPYGDIRVSSFNLSDLSGSYTEGSDDFSHLYTYDGTTRNVSADGTISGTDKEFTQLTNSYSQMINTLKLNNSDKKIYGLHFMDASISTEHTIRVPWVKFADKDPSTLEEGDDVFSTYTDYELPEDSIDFHFKENGIINFFAGTYYEDSTVGANNTFFSLHQIFRYTSGDHKNDIKDIAEIQYIYENIDDDTKAETPYVYYYKEEVDGSRYSPVGEAGNTILFNTDWITNPQINNMDSAYYFEIPAIKGEYALGSVENKAGAYLMYLDLGANANKIARTQVSEHITTTQEIYDYPLGVSFVSSFTRTQGVLNSDPIDSANVMINAGYTGSVTFNRSSDTVTATIGNSEEKTDILGGYRKNTITLTDGTNQIKGIPKETITRDIKRVQLLDYGINYLTLTRTVVEEIVETHKHFGVENNNERVATRTIKQYVYNSDGSLNNDKTITDPSKESSIKVYDPLNTGKPYTDAKNQIFALLDADSNTVIYTMKFPSYEGTVVTLSFELTKGQLNNTYHYPITGYDITVTVSSGTITITISDRNANYTFTINGANANSGPIQIPIS